MTTGRINQVCTSPSELSLTNHVSPRLMLDSILQLTLTFTTRPEKRFADALESAHAEIHNLQSKSSEDSKMQTSTESRPNGWEQLIGCCTYQVPLTPNCEMCEPNTASPNPSWAHTCEPAKIQTRSRLAMISATFHDRNP